MGKITKYMMLHFAVLLFSFTSVFSKSAANAYNEGGITDVFFLLFCFLMLLNCVVYAFFWQIIIKKVPLNVGYANRSVYLIWSQIWAVIFFGEDLTLKNIVGLVIVMMGVVVVSLTADSSANQTEESGGTL